MREICSVILAAGSSRRLGFNKLTLKIDSEAVIVRSVRPFVEAGLGDIIVVAGPDLLSMTRELAGLPVTVVHNEDHSSGMSSSIKAALPWIRGAQAVFFHLGDKPFLRKDLLSDMIEAYRTIAERTDYPLHLGVTEAGTTKVGTMMAMVIMVSFFIRMLRLLFTMDTRASIMLARMFE